MGLGVVPLAQCGFSGEVGGQRPHTGSIVYFILNCQHVLLVAGWGRTVAAGSCSFNGKKALNQVCHFLWIVLRIKLGLFDSSYDLEQHR